MLHGGLAYTGNLGIAPVLPYRKQGKASVGGHAEQCHR